MSLDPKVYIFTTKKPITIRSVEFEALLVKLL